MILVKNWNVAFSSPCAETFIFVVKFWCSGGRKSRHFAINCDFAQNVTLYALKCLSVLMSGWRFCKSSPKYQFWHCKKLLVPHRADRILKSWKCKFSHYNIDDSEVRIPRFFAKLRKCYVLKQKRKHFGQKREYQEITFPEHQNIIGIM